MPQKTAKRNTSWKIAYGKQQSDDSLSNNGSAKSIDFSASASNGSTNHSCDGRAMLCTRYADKISDLLVRYDHCLQCNNYKLVQRQDKCASIYAKFKHFMSNRVTVVTKHRPMWRTSWEYMFKHWLAYGENNPEKRNKVSLRLEPKLNNWVKEQRRHFSNDTLKLDHFNKLDAAGFIFQLCACHGKKLLLIIHPPMKTAA